MSSSSSSYNSSVEFRLFNIPIRINSSFFVILLLLSISLRPVWRMLIWFLVVTFSILVHELGHASAMRLFGLSPSIELSLSGGWTCASDEEASKLKHIVICICGPLAGFFLGGLAVVFVFFLPTDNTVLRTLYTYMFYVNLFWGCVNLLPILPLDGGHIMEQLFFSKHRAGAIGVSVVIGIGLAALSFVNQWHWGIYIVVWCIIVNIWDYQGRRRYERDRHIVDELGTLTVNLAKDPGKVIDDCGRLLSEVRNEHLKNCLLELMAMAYVLNKEDAMAERIIQRIPDSYDPVNVRNLLSGEYFHDGKYEESRKIAEKSFERFHHPSDAYNVACCLVRMDQHGEAIEWLRRAIDAGYGDLDFMKRDADLAALRDYPEFRDLAGEE